MNISILGGGAWGTTLAQVLSDNGHNVLIYEINKLYKDLINQSIHPIFKTDLPKNIKASDNLEELVKFSDIFQISLPSMLIRDALKKLKLLLFEKKIKVINTSKGIETSTFKTIYDICKEEIGKNLDKYATLTGPSHAEETYRRRITFFVSASNDFEFSKFVQNLYYNSEYIRVYTISDLIGAELYGASKNAIAIITGAVTALELGENVRAAIITRGLVELSKISLKLGGKKETAYGLSGIGDLIVTALSTHSRNFKCGYSIGKGEKIFNLLKESKQTIEGVEAIKGFYNFGKKYNLELPLITSAYQVIFENLDIKVAIKALLERDLKSENI